MSEQRISNERVACDIEEYEGGHWPSRLIDFVARRSSERIQWIFRGPNQSRNGPTLSDANIPVTSRNT